MKGLMKRFRLPYQRPSSDSPLTNGTCSKSGVCGVEVSSWRRPSLYSDNHGSLRGLVSDNFLHAGVVGDTIVGIEALSSVLCVEPQIPISLHRTAGLRLPRPEWSMAYPCVRQQATTAYRTRCTLVLAAVHEVQRARGVGTTGGGIIENVAIAMPPAIGKVRGQR